MGRSGRPGPFRPAFPTSPPPQNPFFRFDPYRIHRELRRKFGAFSAADVLG